MDESVSTLTARLFGPFEVQAGDSPLGRLQRRKEKWLLALLVLAQGRPVSRIWLAQTLWPFPETLESRALVNVRKSLMEIRKALGPAADRIRAPDRQTVLLDLEGADVDVMAFDSAVAAGDPASLRRAVSLYRGPLLAECNETWVSLERETRQQAYLRALETLAGQALAEEHYTEAVGYLRKSIAADPLRETAHRSLMESLARSREYQAALQVYQDLCHRLRRDDPKAIPAPETSALYQHIRLQARPRDTTSRPQAPAEMRAPTPHLRVPSPLTDLIGREREALDVADRLRSSRLVTLTGAGGIGKTRLAIAVAEAMVNEYPEGVCFVDLEPISDPHLLVPKLAAAVNVKEEAGDPLLKTVLSHLQSKRLLVVMDNCEHLVEACAPLIEDLLKSCPEITVLATSRQWLGLIGETAFQVPSLSVPPFRQLTRGDSLSLPWLLTYEGVRLFVDRAAAVYTPFELTPENAWLVAQICVRLDGIPLAIELAAVQVRNLSMEELVVSLDGRFHLLESGYRKASPRHKSLYTLVDWSYALLSEPEQKLLRRLAVFVGEWTVEAAESVCMDAGREAEPVAVLLSRLVDRSLVVREAQGAHSRYRLLEIIRQYAQERLHEAGEEDIRKRHRDYFLALAEEAEPHLQGAQSSFWIDRLDQEHDNFRRVLAEAKDAAVCLRLVSALWRFWYARGYIGEGRRWLENALGNNEAADAAVRARALNGAGALAMVQSDYAEAKRRLEECAALSRQIGDEEGYASALHNLGNVALIRTDYLSAQELFDVCLRLFRRFGNRQNIARALISLGTLAQEQADLTNARAYFRESLAIYRELEDKNGIALALNNLGVVAHHERNYTQAREYFEQSLALRRQSEDFWNVAVMLGNLGSLMLEQGDLPAARGFLRESLEIARHLGDRYGAAYVVVAMAAMAAEQQDYARAALLLGADEGLRAPTGAPMHASLKEFYESSLTTAHSALGDQAFTAQWEKGRSLTLEQIGAYVLDAAQ